MNHSFALVSFYSGRMPRVTIVLPEGRTERGPSGVAIWTSITSNRLLRS